MQAMSGNNTFCESLIHIVREELRHDSSFCWLVIRQKNWPSNTNTGAILSKVLICHLTSKMAVDIPSLTDELTRAKLSLMAACVSGRLRPPK